MLKFVLINKGELNWKLPKMLAGKNWRITQKIAERADSIKKALTRFIKKRPVSGR